MNLKHFAIAIATTVMLAAPVMADTPAQIDALLAPYKAKHEITRYKIGDFDGKTLALTSRFSVDGPYTVWSWDGSKWNNLFTYEYHDEGQTENWKLNRLYTSHGLKANTWKKLQRPSLSWHLVK